MVVDGQGFYPNALTEKTFRVHLPLFHLPEPDPDPAMSTRAEVVLALSVLTGEHRSESNWLLITSSKEGAGLGSTCYRDTR